MAFTDRLHNRGSISTGYDIDNSCKFEADNVEYLTRTPSSDGDRQKFTISLWVKRTELGTYQTLYGAQPSSGYTNNNTFQFCFTPDDKIGLGLQTYWVFQTNAVYRDTSAWYHIVVRADSTQPFSHNRIRLYINGTQNTSFSTNALSSISEDMLFGVNHTTRQQIGSLIANSWHSSCYISEVNLVDGQSHAPSYFGEFDQDSGIWKPKKYAGTYGTNGFYLNFDNASAMGADSSGNNHTWTLNNITSADQSTDTPTNNFCTLNILNASSKNAGGNNEYTEGATKGKALQESEMASGTMAVTQGKWYYECKAVSNSEIMAGWGVPNLWGHHTANPGYDDYSFAVHNIGRVYYSGNAYIDLSPSVSFDTNDIISCAIDIDNGFCYWAKNGTWMNGGSPTSGATGTGGFDFQSASAPGNLAIEDGDFLVPAFRTNYYTNSAILVNFGGYTTISISSAASDADGYGTFEYAPPSGYYALCTKNLEEYG